MYFPLQWRLQVLSCIVFSIIGFSGSLKKVDNSKYINRTVIYNHLTNMAWIYADIHKLEINNW